MPNVERKNSNSLIRDERGHINIIIIYIIIDKGIALSMYIIITIPALKYQYMTTKN